MKKQNSGKGNYVDNYKSKNYVFPPLSSFNWAKKQSHKNVYNCYWPTAYGNIIYFTITAGRRWVGTKVCESKEMTLDKLESIERNEKIMK